MRSPIARIAIGAGVLILATVGLLVFSMLQQAKVSCEVCVTFGGNTQCRTALGPTRNEAVRTATTTACASLASGMTDSIACANTTPLVVTCDDGSD